LAALRVGRDAVRRRPGGPARTRRRREARPAHALRDLHRRRRRRRVARRGRERSRRARRGRRGLEPRGDPARDRRVGARRRRLGRACREGIKALGLELFSPDDDSSAVVTAVRMPDGFDSGDLVRGLRDRFGITIANGQGDLKGKIFRIGHIGYYDVFDVTTALAATEVALGDLGVAIEHGGAATRALEAYEDATRV